MKAKGKNVSNLRIDNRRLILEYLNEVGESSRIKIAKELGLTKASLTIMANQMIEEGIVIETGEVDTGRVGRKEVRIAINPNFGKVLGISLEKNGVDITLADIKANVLDHCECNDENYINRIKTIIEENDDIRLIGITFVGNERNRAVILKESLHKLIQVPVFIEHNVAALTEAHRYISHSKDFIFIKYGPGIGSAVVIDGELVENLESGIGNVMVGDERLEDLISYKAFKQRHSIDENIELSSKDIAQAVEVNQKVKEDVVRSIGVVMTALRNAAEFIGVKKVIVYGYVLNKENIFTLIQDANNDYLDLCLTPLVDNKVSIAAVYHALYQGFMSKGGII